MSRNQLSGTVPDSIGNLINLEKLSISFNQFQGSVPAALGRLTKLGELFLSNNQFSGQVPQELLALTSLVECQFQNAGFCLQNGDVIPAICNTVPGTFRSLIHSMCGFKYYNCKFYIPRNYYAYNNNHSRGNADLCFSYNNIRRYKQGGNTVTIYNVYWSCRRHISSCRRSNNPVNLCLRNMDVQEAPTKASPGKRSRPAGPCQRNRCLQYDSRDDHTVE